jgi:hypothetical protein
MPQPAEESLAAACDDEEESLTAACDDAAPILKKRTIAFQRRCEPALLLLI